MVKRELSLGDSGMAQVLKTAQLLFLQNNYFAPLFYPFHLGLDTLNYLISCRFKKLRESQAKEVQRNLHKQLLTPPPMIPTS